MAQKEKFLAAVDIGTTKIVAIVGELQTDGSVEVVGLGSHPSRGLRDTFLSEDKWFKE